jgi:hypothetical protein
MNYASGGLIVPLPHLRMRAEKNSEQPLMPQENYGVCGSTTKKNGSKYLPSVAYEKVLFVQFTLNQDIVSRGLRKKQ